MLITKVEVTSDASFLVNGKLGVPDDMANRHRRKVQAWIDAGNKAAIEKRRSDVKAKYPKPE